MAKLLFVQSLDFEYLGPMYISALLKKHKHQVSLAIGNKASDFSRALHEFKPDFVAFSIMSGSHLWALKIAQEIKSSGRVLTLFGGAHPTYFPGFVNNSGVDIIVRGEGEEACLELLNCFDRGEDYSKIANLWINRNGTIITNEVRPFNRDLDAYPFPDRMLYYHALKDRIDLSIRSLVTSRGCPMRCSFCFNDSMRGLYQGKGKYVRTRKIEKVIEEALDLKAHSQTRIITFTDDVFGVNATWLKEFLPIYRREVGLPFTCLLRADIVSRNPEIPQLLADAGCVLVSFGIESGNEEFRNSLLNKRVTDQEILASAKLLHAAGISFRTYNILGLPGETLTQAWSTVQINIDIKTDFPWCSTFMPFPGTRLTEHAVTQSFLPKDFSQDALMPSFFASSSLTNNPDMRKLENLQRFFQTLVLWPWTKPMVKRLISLPPNFLFTLWFGWVYFIVHVKAERRNLFKTLVFTAKNAKKLFV